MTFRGSFDVMRLSAGNAPSSTATTSATDFPNNTGRFMTQPSRTPLAWLPRVAASQQSMTGGGDPGGCSPWLLDTSLPPLQNVENILGGKPHPLHNNHHHHPQQQQQQQHHRLSASTVSPMMSDRDARLKQCMVTVGGGETILPHLFRPDAGYETAGSGPTTGSNKWDSDMSDACIINTACLGGFTLNAHQPPLLENGLSAFRLKDNNINNHHNNENLFSAIDNGDFEGYSWPELTLTDFTNQNGEIMGFHNPPVYEEETKEGPDDDRLMFLLLQLGIHRCPVLPNLHLQDNELDLYSVHH